MMRIVLSTFFILAGAVGNAYAQMANLPPLDDKYHVSNEEKAACSGDAVRLCSEAYPDADALVACMKAKHAELSGRCKVAFDTGIKRRHL